MSQPEHDPELLAEFVLVTNCQQRVPLCRDDHGLVVNGCPRWQEGLPSVGDIFHVLQSSKQGSVNWYTYRWNDQPESTEESNEHKDNVRHVDTAQTVNEDVEYQTQISSMVSKPIIRESIELQEEVEVWKPDQRHCRLNADLCAL